MHGPDDILGHTAILNSLEKRWAAAEQDIFIAAVIVNPLYQATPFASLPRFTNARIKYLLASLYSRFFDEQDVPSHFYTELHDFLMASGQYDRLEAICDQHMSTAKSEVR